MAIEITVPRLGWNMEEGTFVGWLKPDGAEVRAGEPLFSLEGEKATEEIECFDAGILRIPPDGPREGDKVAVGVVIGYLLQPGELAPWADKETRRQGDKETRSSEVREQVRAGVVAPEIPPTVSSVSLSPCLPVSLSAKKRTISPRAKRAAAELGVDWTGLQGSGRTGRIRERDVRAAAPATQGTMVAVSSIRRTIAKRMLASHQSTAPVTLNTTLDASNLVNLREQFKAALAAGNDVVPSYTDFLVKLTSIALRKHPLLNSSWGDEQVRMSSAIHIGIAVDTDAGLLVPVLRDVPSLSVKQVAGRSRELIERARQGKLTADELSGGTFTVTNLGAFGIETFTPILNVPQCAILGVGRIQRRPAVIDDKIVAREQLGLSLTFDHRIVDGAPAARFVQTLSALIESPGPWLMG